MVVILLYILIQSVSQGVLGSELVNFTATPLAETARAALGPIGYTILFFGAIISMFGYLSGSILNNPRVVYALARDKVIPVKSLAKIHKSFATPYIAIIIYTFIVFIIAASGSFEKLAIIASSAMLIVYLAVALSVIKLRKTHKSQEGEFKIPGGLLVPILAIMVILYFLYNMSSKEMIATVIGITFLTILFSVIKFIKKRV